MEGGREASEGGEALCSEAHGGVGRKNNEETEETLHALDALVINFELPSDTKGKNNHKQKIKRSKQKC